MSVAGGTVSLSAVSTTRTAASFAERIGLPGTTCAEIGDLRGNGRSGFRHQTALWALDLDCPDGAVEPLNEALRQLLAQFDGREDILHELRPHWDLRVQCWGSSNSVQGGFWLDRPVLQGLARLGVDFICTVYLDDPDDD